MENLNAILKEESIRISDVVVASNRWRIGRILEKEFLVDDATFPAVDPLLASYGSTSDWCGEVIRENNFPGAFVALCMGELWRNHSGFSHSFLWEWLTSNGQLGEFLSSIQYEFCLIADRLYGFEIAVGIPCNLWDRIERDDHIMHSGMVRSIAAPSDHDGAVYVALRPAVGDKKEIFLLDDAREHVCSVEALLLTAKGRKIRTLSPFEKNSVQLNTEFFQIMSTAYLPDTVGRRIQLDLLDLQGYRDFVW